jgi:SAM-dependent methyltransferase
VPHPHIVLREFARIIKPGGKVLLTVPQWNEFHEVPHDYFRYTRFGLETLFTDNGFTITAMEPRGKYFSEHAQMRIRYLINRWKPYERSWAMWIVAPISILLTKYALLRDRLSTHPAAELHTIGWCVIAQKST